MKRETHHVHWCLCAVLRVGSLNFLIGLLVNINGSAVVFNPDSQGLLMRRFDFVVFAGAQDNPQTACEPID